MKFRFVAALAFLLASCSLPNADSGVKVDTSKIVITHSGAHAISVSGQPGTLPAGAATTVTLTIQRPSAATPSPAAYRLQHFGNHLPVFSSYASVNADGSFGPVTLGDDTSAVQPGDELDVTPEKGVAQAGYTVFVTIP